MHIPVVSDAWNQFNKQIDAGKQNKGVAVRASLESVRSLPQGLALGVANWQFSKIMKDQMSNPEIRNKMTPEQLKMQANNMTMPLGRSIGGMVALFSVQKAAEEVVSHFRKERDTWNAVIPAACGGLAFGAVSAQPGTNPLTMAIGFAGFTALIDRFSGGGGASLNPQEAKKQADARYEQSQFMLTNLGLEKYHRKLKNGLLTDDTIMLWNDSVLSECKIPPGPRLLILDHLEHVKSEPKHVRKGKGADALPGSHA